MVANKIEVVPSAKRMVRSLRDMGYEFAAAVADLIDNSIEARSHTVNITVVWNGAASFVMIADNGEGMSPELLKEALRFGSEREYDDADLGKFGLGLKTASLSQCLKVTVASRWNENRADINAYCWDVHHIEKTNRWEILNVKAADLPELARLQLKKSTGTVIIWEQLDRLLGYRSPGGEFARRQLLAMIRELEDHVSMVFHRYLSGEVRGKKLDIFINENKVEAWDPFAREEKHCVSLEATSLRLDGTKGKGDVIVEPYVLPSQSLFSSAEAFNRASGPRKWNAQQGFYIYRADRMIQNGGWCGLRATDEHRKLSRIAISFSPKLDEEFKINVPKMRVQLPSALKDDIERSIRPAIKMAEEVYRKGKSNNSSSSVSLVPKPTSAQTHQSPFSPDLTPHANRPISTEGKPRATKYELDVVADLLLQVATPAEVTIIENTVARARKKLESL